MYFKIRIKCSHLVSYRLYRDLHNLCLMWQNEGSEVPAKQIMDGFAAAFELLRLRKVLIIMKLLVSTVC